MEEGEGEGIEVGGGYRCVDVELSGVVDRIPQGIGDKKKQI